MDDEDSYINLQGAEGDYEQQPGSLYADAGTGARKATATPAGKAAAPSKPAAPPVILVSVNPASKIKGPAFIALLTKTKGLPAELKGKIKFDKKANAISLPDFSKSKVVPGKEWIFDLGKAANDWEVTTATLIFSLDGPTSFRLDQDLQKGEERGFILSPDPDDSLLKPATDLKDVNAGIILGLTIPNQALLNKNPPPEGTLPPPQIARLQSGKGLILIAYKLVVEKKTMQTTDLLAIPDSMKAMSFFHELSAHASFFELGQNAAHSVPFDPSGNAVDRNAQQVATLYNPAISKEQAAFEKKMKALIDGMNKKLP